MTDLPEGSKDAKRRMGRSPAYPYISVQKALQQARALYDQEGEYAAPLSSVAAAWGYSAKSSGGRQTLATMKYYGLIEVSGEGDARKVKISDTARRIILDNRDDDREKRQLVRQVAITPAAHKLLLEQYPNGLASDGSIEHFLIFDAGYNKDAAKELLAEFKETSEFVRLYEKQEIGEVSKADGAEEIEQVKVGDRVQVTVGGVDLFADGAKVVGLSDDGKWVFTDQSDSAAKLEEVTLVERSSPAPGEDRPSVPQHMLKGDTTTQKGTRRAVFPIPDGDVVLTFPSGMKSASFKRLKRYLDIFLDEEIESTE